VAVVKPVPLDKEIILVNDGSRDSSPALIDALADGDRVRAYHHPRNIGQGATGSMPCAHWYATVLSDKGGRFLTTFLSVKGGFRRSYVEQNSSCRSGLEARN